MATTFELNARPRVERGKGAARKIRAAADIPAILYGRGDDPVLLRLSNREFLRTIGGRSVSNMIIDLRVDGAEVVKALIREIQIDPLTNEVYHVDLNRISMTERMEIDVPVELFGMPTGVKDFGGVLSHPVRTITVLCLPTEIPESIRVDVSALKIGDSIHARDLQREGITILEPAVVVASVSAPSTAEVAPTEAPAAEPEVITEKKTEGKESGGD